MLYELFNNESKTNLMTSFVCLSVYFRVGHVTVVRNTAVTIRKIQKYIQFGRSLFLSFATERKTNKKNHKRENIIT